MNFSCNGLQTAQSGISHRETHRHTKCFQNYNCFHCFRSRNFRMCFFLILTLLWFPLSHYFLGNLHSTNGRITQVAFLGSRLKREHCINTVLSMNHCSMKHNWLCWEISHSLSNESAMHISSH